MWIWLFVLVVTLAPKGLAVLDYSCVQVQAEVMSPTNQYYTMVKVSGSNKCAFAIDLTKCSISYASNYPAGSMWGSSILDPNKTPTHKNNTVRIYLGQASAWSPTTLGVGATFALNYGVSITSGNMVYINDTAFNPPPNDDAIVDVLVEGSHMMIRDVLLMLYPLDEQTKKPFTRVLANVSVAQTIRFENVIYGRYKLNATSGNSCNDSAMPAVVTVIDDKPISAKMNWRCPDKYFTAIALTVGPKPLESLAQNAIDVTLSIADTRKILSNRTVPWDDLLIWSYLPYDEYVIQFTNITDGANLISTPEQNVNLTTYLQVVTPEYNVTRLPTVHIPIILTSQNRTSFSLVFRSRKYHADYTYNSTVDVNETMEFHVELPENDEFTAIVRLEDDSLHGWIEPSSKVQTVNLTDPMQSLDVYIQEKEPILPILSIFWCGFGRDFCGQSKGDDVYPKTTHVILAFGNTAPNGSIIVDTMPDDLIQQWHNDGKKVLISVGGQNGHWQPIFKNPEIFVESIARIIEDNNLDGVDLDIEGYATPPKIVSETLFLLRKRLGKKKLIVVSPENVTVYPTPFVGIPNWETGTGAYNYFVHIINATVDIVDFFQPQFYNNNYLTYGNNGNSDAIVENYLGWINKYPGYQIPDFAGVPEEKVVIGVPASTSAANPAFYVTGEDLIKAIKQLQKDGHYVRGVMMWDSNWDALNDFEISSAAADALKL